MPDMKLVADLLSAVASVGQILQAAISFYKPDRSANESEFNKAVRQAEGIRIQPSANIRLIMSKEVIDVIRERIYKIKEEVIEIHSNDNIHDGAKRSMLRECVKKFCWNLDQIKKHNGGGLPPDLQEEWHMHMCDDFGFS